MSKLYNLLDKHWLWKEMRTQLSLSNPAYTYWRETNSLKLNRYVFIEKRSVPARYEYIQGTLTDLSGFLPTQYAAQQLGVDSHIFNTKEMHLHSKFEYKFVENIKFVNIKRFFLDNGIYVKKHSFIQVGKLKDLEFGLDSQFYRIDNDYGVLVFD